MAAETERVEPQDSEQDDEEDVYEVERIIDMRVEEGDVLYRVRWKNYCSDDDTWEPEAHLEDCREVLLAFKKNIAEAKAKKEAEVKKTLKLPTKSDVFDADSESDSDKDQPVEMPVKKKKKKKNREREEEPPPKEKRKKKKEKRRDDLIKPLPAPETDDEEEMAQTPPLPIREKKTDLKKRAVDSDDEEEAPAPLKKHKKDKGKDAVRHKKEKREESKKKKGKRERKLDSSEDEATAPLESDLSDEPSQSNMEDVWTTDAKAVERAWSDDKSKQRKGKSELKLQGVSDLTQERRSKKSDSAAHSQKDKAKSLSARGKEDPAPHSSDSSDSSALHKKAKSKAPESSSAQPKAPSSSASSSSSSFSAAGSSGKAKEEDLAKEDAAAQKDAAGSTNLFEKFLLTCEAKDLVPRRQTIHQPAAAEISSKTAKQLIGKIEKKAKPIKETPASKPEADKSEKTKQPDAARPSQSHGFSLDEDEKGAEELTPKPRYGDDSRERKERPEEVQRSSWERRAPVDDKRVKRREDGEPRLFMACDDSLDPQEPMEGTEKSDKGPATLSLGMDLNLDWMTLEDFQKHLNGEDELLSGPPLSPSELRDAVKSGDYMSVKLALNSKEDYNLDQEASAIDEKRSFEEDKSLTEERSSSDDFRFNLSMDSTRDVCPNAAHMTLKKDENITKGRDSHNEHNSVSNSAHFFTERDGTNEQGGMPDTNVVPGQMSLKFQHQSLSSDAEGILEGAEKHPLGEEGRSDVGQTCTVGEKCFIKKENTSSDEEDGVEGVEACGPPARRRGRRKTLQVKSKPIGRRQSGRPRKTREIKQPTRSSSRTSKKVLETSNAVDEDDQELCKKHFCLYCKTPFSRLVRHLERKHSDETDVAHAIHFPKGSKIRQTLLDQIRNKGDYEHNCEVLKSGEGEIVTKKQMNDPTLSVRDYLPCQHCFAFYRKTDLWRHERSCKVKKGDPKPANTPKRCRAQSAASRLLPMSEFLTGGCAEIVHIMHQDDISRHVRNDPLICKYGNTLSAKHDHDKSQFAYIAQKMRELGRFVLAVNELDSSVQYLHEICLPSRFELAVEGAKKVSGFDPNSTKFKTASLVSKIGYSLKRAAEIAFGESRMTEDSETEGQVKKFIQLLDTKWNQSFSRKALASSLHKQEVNKVEMDKSTLEEDLIKLHRFVKKEGDQAKRELKESPNSSTWRKLCEATITEVCLLNRGRVGNIGRMLLQTYNSRQSKINVVPSADQIMKSTKLELELGNDFTRLELQGQCGRNMLVLLNKRMVMAIDLLVEHREKAGVPKDNPYVFARNEGSSYIRGLDCFRRAAVECGLKNTETILSSTLREQIGCYWQLMSLSESELDQVAKLVGRSSQDFYRLKDNPSQLEEVSKQLLKMDRTLSPPRATGDGTAPRSTSKKKSWNENEQAAVKRYLGDYIALMKVPGKKQCNECIAAEPALLNRSWTDVKNYVHNTLQTIRKKHYQGKPNGGVTFSKPTGSKEAIQIKHEDLSNENNAVCRMTAQPTDCRESQAKFAVASTFPLNNTTDVSGYPPMVCASTNMVHTSQPMVPTFTPLNATDTQMFTTQIPGNPSMPPVYLPRNTTSAPIPPMYTPQHTTTTPLVPTFSPLNAPSSPMVPTFTPLNAPSSTVVPTFTPLSDRNGPMVSSFTPLNHSSTLGYSTSPPRPSTTTQAVSATRPSTVLDTAPAVQTTSPLSPAGEKGPPAAKTQKRTKRLWSEEEQAAVRRQLGDICKLVKAPGKKECDACLAAEPALSRRTWREVKYFVHNTIQSFKKRGSAPIIKHTIRQDPEVNHLSTEWDAPVYLSL